MSMARVMVAAAGIAGLVGVATADETVVTFDEGNFGGWSYFGDPANPIELIEGEGGNPGAWLHCTCDGINCLDTFAPQLRSFIGSQSPFVGDYRAAGVTSLGVDLILLNDATAGGRPLTLILRDTNETPDDILDDTFVYFVGPDNIPLPGEGWKSYDFDVPASSETLPDGWKVTFDSVFQGDDAWNVVIEDVDQVTFFYGDPENFFIFQQWEPGADNVRITAGGGCYADFNGDGSLDILDFVAFQNAFVGGDESADCDGDGALNILDFVCFQNAFGAGCP
jgi:hypothetical protein